MENLVSNYITLIWTQILKLIKMLPTPFILSDQQRQIRFFTQDVIPFLHNISFQITNHLPFEAEPHQHNDTHT